MSKLSNWSRRKQSGSSYYDTYAEVQGVELDPVRVFYYVSPAEPDVNWAGDLEIESVEYQGRDVFPDMTDREQEAIREQINDWLIASAEDERY